MKPLGFNDYVKLQKVEQSSILALNIREAHEASVMMVGLEKTRILQGLEVLLTQNLKKSCMFCLILIM